MVGADQQDAGELAMRARGRLQGDGIHAGNIEQATLQQTITSSVPWASASGR